MSISLAIVEDLDEVRDGLKQYLSMQPDFLVLATYQNAEEAVIGLPQVCPDLVIMDINLQGMNGIECIRQVKEQIPRTQFMMFTVYENDEKVFEALKAGAAGYLLKSAGLQQMTEALKELNQGGSPMSSNIARKLVKTFQDKPVEIKTKFPLSPRESEILNLLATGLLYKEIADKLGISHNTVKQHIHKIYEKLHVQNRTEALNMLYRGQRM